jgi:hypothetical protein
MRKNKGTRRRKKKVRTVEEITKSLITRYLRRAWRSSPQRNQALKRDEYSCKMCGKKKSTSRKLLTDTEHYVKVIQVHHVGNGLRGALDWNEHIKRLFCPASGLLCLCKDCHKVETKKQRGLVL